MVSHANAKFPSPIKSRQSEGYLAILLKSSVNFGITQLFSRAHFPYKDSYERGKNGNPVLTSVGGFRQAHRRSSWPLFSMSEHLPGSILILPERWGSESRGVG